MNAIYDHLKTSNARRIAIHFTGSFTSYESLQAIGNVIIVIQFSNHNPFNFIPLVFLQAFFKIPRCVSANRNGKMRKDIANTQRPLRTRKVRIIHFTPGFSEYYTPLTWTVCNKKLL